MIIPKTAEEIELMRESALLVSKTLGEVAKVIKPGVTTLELDKLAEEFIRDKNNFFKLLLLHVVLEFKNVEGYFNNLFGC